MPSPCSPIVEPFVLEFASAAANSTASRANATHTAGLAATLAATSAVPLPLLQGVVVNAYIQGPGPAGPSLLIGTMTMRPPANASSPAIATNGTTNSTTNGTTNSTTNAAAATINGTLNTWTIAIGASFTLRAGRYNLTLQTSPPAVLNLLDGPLALEVRAAAPAAANSTLAVAPPATGAAVGGVAVVTVRLFDVFGNPRPDTLGAALTVTGAVTGAAVVPAASLTPVNGTPGAFAYAHMFGAPQNVSFALTASGAPAVGSPYAMRAAGVIPSAINYTASIAATTLAVDGASPLLARPAAVGYGAVAAEAWHTLHVPAVRAISPALGGFVADPGLITALRVVPLHPNGTRDDAHAAAFNGSWSWTGGAYAIAFKLRAVEMRVNTTYLVSLSLAHPSGAPSAAASVDFSLTAALSFAAPAGSSFALQTVAGGGNNASSVGDPVYAIASLFSAAGRPVYISTNVAVTATGVCVKGGALWLEGALEVL